ncbi:MULTISPECIES: hypothetical protein [Bacillus]|uniref:Uncharacterized protein n=2 Tax=Bacillus thuringiensis TaxID=1428 RepID=A0AAP4V2I1_BACTU|nr:MULTISPECIES: hypothetical protein [Bacillus]MEC0048139.1 hypothetical protein [Bacillus cereus]AFV21441.1 hypothetical protein BTB_502p01050 [Bacillus thuringiensis Bt407]ERI01383.1 hypothetical protein BTCBT_002971 [Bacillus thuringiensis T01-328]MBN6708111.1 hypothetical protein [Bacillus thuringiensis]MDN7078734.1 hypothetical protein [Bacillus thuringiensis]
MKRKDSINRLKEIKSELEKKLSQLDKDSSSYQMLKNKIGHFSEAIDLLNVYFDSNGVSTATMIQTIQVGQIAQCMNSPRTNELDLCPAYNNAYCVKKYEDGSIRWLFGKKRTLRMTPFVVDNALWVLQKQ